MYACPENVSLKTFLLAKEKKNNNSGETRQYLDRRPEHTSKEEPVCLQMQFPGPHGYLCNAHKAKLIMDMRKASEKVQRLYCSTTQEIKESCGNVPDERRLKRHQTNWTGDE